VTHVTAKAQAIYDLLQMVLDDLADELIETHGTVNIDLKISTSPPTPTGIEQQLLQLRRV